MHGRRDRAWTCLTERSPGQAMPRAHHPTAMTFSLLELREIGGSQQRPRHTGDQRARFLAFVPGRAPLRVGRECGARLLPVPEIVPLQHIVKIVGVLSDVHRPEPDRTDIVFLPDANCMLAEAVYESRKLSGRC